MYREEEIISLRINKIANGNDHQLCIDILNNDYNMIETTIYNEELAQKIIDLINENINK